MNPFYTPYEYTPFDTIKETDYEPAILKGIEEEDKEIDQIVNQPEAPTFENTIEALDRTGELLGKVTSVFYNQLSAETSDYLDELSQRMSPILTEHSNNITLNKRLFRRVKAVYENHAAKDFKDLDAEQKMLLTTTYEGFVRKGANLPDEQQKRLRALSAELSVLTLQFSQNKLKDTNDFLLHITNEEDLEGLPESAINLARQTAKERNMEGYAFTLQAPSYMPFLTYSAKRELREKMYLAYHTLCTHPNDNNNTDIVRKIVNLRREMAQMLGYDTYADYALAHRMAEKPQAVYDLLNQLIDAYMPTAQAEVKAVEDLCHQTLNLQPFMPWDFPYYANKLKESRYNLNSEMLRPYFQLAKVKEGVFGLAHRLYGITFRRNHEVPVYHPDVEVYDVMDKDDSPLALLYADFHPRTSKKSGAWMTSYKEQWKEKNGKNSRPQVAIVMNLSKATDEQPALLTLGEVETFLHEFGHALHGIFANTNYRSLSGTNVSWEFVELHSQFLTNFNK